MSVVGFGKVILLGEHAVVYGYPALASALASGVTLEAAPGALSLELPEWGVMVEVEPEAGTAAAVERALGGEAVHPVAQALQAIAAEVAACAGCPLERVAARLWGSAAIWAGAGLGSSAAMTVAVARALAGHVGAPLTEQELREAAGAGERVFHGKPSGLDVALAVSGRAGVFTRAGGLVELELPPLTLVIGHSGAPRSTARMVARVAERTGGDRDDERLRALAEAAEEGIAAAGRGELAALGAAMRRAQRGLASLGVSTEMLDEMCASAEAAGALGAKLTGAGGGGCAIALVGDEEAAGRVEAEWRARQLATRIERLGGRGAAIRSA
jgi:mevalonate kinase